MQNIDVINILLTFHKNALIAQFIENKENYVIE